MFDCCCNRQSGAILFFSQSITTPKKSSLIMKFASLLIDMNFIGQAEPQRTQSLFFDLFSFHPSLPCGMRSLFLWGQQKRKHIFSLRTPRLEQSGR